MLAPGSRPLPLSPHIGPHPPRRPQLLGLRHLPLVSSSTAATIPPTPQSSSSFLLSDVAGAGSLLQIWTAPPPSSRSRRRPHLERGQGEQRSSERDRGGGRRRESTEPGWTTRRRRRREAEKVYELQDTGAPLLTRARVDEESPLCFLVPGEAPVVKCSPLVMHCPSLMRGEKGKGGVNYRNRRWQHEKPMGELGIHELHQTPLELRPIKSTGYWIPKKRGDRRIEIVWELLITKESPRRQKLYDELASQGHSSLLAGTILLRLSKHYVPKWLQ